MLSPPLTIKSHLSYKHCSCFGWSTSYSLAGPTSLHSPILSQHSLYIPLLHESFLAHSHSEFYHNFPCVSAAWHLLVFVGHASFNRHFIQQTLNWKPIEFLELCGKTQANRTGSCTSEAHLLPGIRTLLPGYLPSRLWVSWGQGICPVIFALAVLTNHVAQVSFWKCCRRTKDEEDEGRKKKWTNVFHSYLLSA